MAKLDDCETNVKWKFSSSKQLPQKPELAVGAKEQKKEKMGMK